MGKPKTKKSRQSITSDDIASRSHEPQCTCNHDPPRAADGHNVEGWTDDDIRIYNELLTERAKLEREKVQLEQQSARHQAQRVLLNEDAAAFDNLFKAQLGGEYKFTGKASCCLDILNDSGSERSSRSKCHHEICARAKAQGVSWMEMDTIKYYQARITSEKSQRMKNALRKQREVELTRVKKDDEEENALRARKSALQDRLYSEGKDDSGSPALSNGKELALTSNALTDPRDNTILEAAKENETVVKRIRSRLDKIRHDVSTGRVTAFDARAKLDQANREMAEAERKNNTFKELVMTASSSQELVHANATNLSRALSKSLATSTGDAFSQALNVMKGFFSASDPRDVQAAITDLRTVLEINGPMSPVLQKSFQALEDMLAKPNAKGFSVDLTNKDGTKRTCTNVVEVLLMLRNSEDPTSLDATAEELKLDKATLQANRECIKIEKEAMEDMRAILKDYNGPDDNTIPRYKDMMERFKQIKNDAALKSPIPPLSDIVLEDDMNKLFYAIILSDLFLQVQAGVSERDISGKMTSMVIAFSGRDPERYMSTIQNMLNGFATFRTDLEYINVVRRACETVHESMAKFVEKHREKMARAATEKPSQSPSSPSIPDSLVPGPLQLKKSTKSGKGIPSPFGSLPGLDASQLASLDMSGVMKVVQNMQQQLKGLTPDDLVNMLCTPEAGQADMHATNILKGDLQKFLNLPTGLEDPKLLSRIQQQIAHLASHDKSRVRESPHAQEAKSKNSRESKFQEELSSSPSPPPYTANEGRTRSSVKVKHVPVNTPQISDVAAGLDISDRERLISAAREFQAKTLEQKAQEMSNDLHKMRKDLLELTNLPGLSGNLAKKVRRQLDSLRKDMEKMEISDPVEEIRVATAAIMNGADANSTAAQIRELQRLAPSPPNDEAVTTVTKKKSKKKGSKKQPTDFSQSSTPLPQSSSGAPVTNGFETRTQRTSDGLLCDRELMIQRQLYTLACSLDRLLDDPGPAADRYGFKDAFRGIVGKLEEQMVGHLEIARYVSDVNGWTGLEDWLDRTF